MHFCSVCAALCVHCVSHFTGQLVVYGRVNVITEPLVNYYWIHFEQDVGFLFHLIKKQNKNDMFSHSLT